MNTNRLSIRKRERKKDRKKEGKEKKKEWRVKWMSLNISHNLLLVTIHSWSRYGHTHSPIVSNAQIFDLDGQPKPMHAPKFPSNFVNVYGHETAQVKIWSRISTKLEKTFKILGSFTTLNQSDLCVRVGVLAHKWCPISGSSRSRPQVWLFPPFPCSFVRMYGWHCTVYQEIDYIHIKPFSLRLPIAIHAWERRSWTWTHSNETACQPVKSGRTYQDFDLRYGYIQLVWTIFSSNIRARASTALVFRAHEPETHIGWGQFTVNSFYYIPTENGIRSEASFFLVRVSLLDRLGSIQPHGLGGGVIMVVYWTGKLSDEDFSLSSSSLLGNIKEQKFLLLLFVPNYAEQFLKKSNP